MSSQTICLWSCFFWWLPKRWSCHNPHASRKNKSMVMTLWYSLYRRGHSCCFCWQPNLVSLQASQGATTNLTHLCSPDGEGQRSLQDEGPGVSWGQKNFLFAVQMWSAFNCITRKSVVTKAKFQLQDRFSQCIFNKRKVLLIPKSSLHWDCGSRKRIQKTYLSVLVFIKYSPEKTARHTCVFPGIFQAFFFFFLLHLFPSFFQAVKSKS